MPIEENESVLSDQLDDNYEETSAPQEEESQETAAHQEEQDAGEEQENNAPEEDFESRFDKHPRFQELNNNLKAERENRERLEAQLRSTQEQFERFQNPPKADPLVERLKALDKESGSTVFTDLLKSQDSLKEVQGKLEQYETMMQEKAVVEAQQRFSSEVSKLHEQNSIPDAARELIEAAVVKKIQSDPELASAGFDKLPEIYKQAKASYDAIEKSIRAQYVAQRKQANSAPTSTSKPTPTKGKQKAKPVEEDYEAWLDSIGEEVAREAHSANNV